MVFDDPKKEKESLTRAMSLPGISMEKEKHHRSSGSKLKSKSKHSEHKDKRLKHPIFVKKNSYNSVAKTKLRRRGSGKSEQEMEEEAKMEVGDSRVLQLEVENENLLAQVESLQKKITEME